MYGYARHPTLHWQRIPKANGVSASARLWTTSALLHTLLPEKIPDQLRGPTGRHVLDTVFDRTSLARPTIRVVCGLLVVYAGICAVVRSVFDSTVACSAALIICRSRTSLVTIGRDSDGSYAGDPSATGDMILNLSISNAGVVRVSQARVETLGMLGLSFRTTTRSYSLSRSFFERTIQSELSASLILSLSLGAFSIRPRCGPACAAGGARTSTDRARWRTPGLPR